MTDARALASSTAARHGAAENAPEFSSSSKFRHGGPRENSGGPRENSGGPRENSGGFRDNSGGARPGAGRPRNPPVDPWEEPSFLWKGPRWCVYQTHSQAERLAAEELARSGYRAYAPQIAILRRDRVIPTMMHKVLVPRMPGYGFVELAPTDPWVPVQNTAGIRCVLLSTSGKPAICGVGEVERQMADDERLCDLSSEPPEVMECFDVGMRVRIEGGAFAQFYATVIECDGMVTMVEVGMFGRMVQTRLARATLVAIIQS